MNRKYQALIVDDQQTALVIIEHVMQSLRDDMNTFTFSSSLKALDWAKNNQADIIVIDYMIPEMSGIEFCEEIRRLENYDSVPIVMITGSKQGSLKYAALDAGVTDFLVKPIDIHECQARLRNLLNLRTQYLHLVDKNQENYSINYNKGD